MTCTTVGTNYKRFVVHADQVSPDPAQATATTASSNTQPNTITGTPPTLFERLFGFNYFALGDNESGRLQRHAVGRSHKTEEIFLVTADKLRPATFARHEIMTVSPIKLVPSTHARGVVDQIIIIEPGRHAIAPSLIQDARLRDDVLDHNL